MPSNHFTATNLAASDVVLDNPSPGSNYCVLNTLDVTGSFTFSEGNLKATGAGSAANRVTGTLGVSSRKWYFEAEKTTSESGSNYQHWGVYDASETLGSGSALSSGGNATASEWVFADDGDVANNGTGSASGLGGVSQNDIVQIAIDIDTGKFWVGLNNTWDGDPAAGTGEAYSNLPATVVPFHHEWGTGKATLFNFGQSGFAHTPPTGFKALSTANLPTPTIAKPSEHFSTKLYSGTGNTTQNITGVGFQPDLVWIKKRQSGSHYLLDSVRGLNDLHPGSTATESSSSGRFNSFDSDGFQVEHSGGGGGFTNGASQTYAAWNWLAEDGFEAVSGVSDSGSKNVDAGFSIVTWTGNDSGGFSPTPQSVSHGLTVTPELIIAKPRTANGMGNGSWVVWTKDLSSGTYLIMNTTAGEASWSDALVSSIDDSSVSFGSDTMGNGEDLNADSFGGADTYVGYLFATVAGHSKVGLYNGNSADNFVALDFAPAWILIKSTGNPSSSGHWIIKDNKRSAAYNPADGNLYANDTYAEDTTASVDIDLLSNGFNIKGTYAGINATSSSYIFLAMAEKPLKYASAR